MAVLETTTKDGDLIEVTESVTLSVRRGGTDQIYGVHGRTIYLTPEEAEKIGVALIKAAAGHGRCEHRPCT